MDMAGTGGPTSRSEVCAAAVMEASRLFANCDPDFNSGDRGECGGFQRPECANRAPIECFRPATALQCRAQATWLVYAVLSRLSRLPRQEPYLQRHGGLRYVQCRTRHASNGHQELRLSCFRQLLRHAV